MIHKHYNPKNEDHFCKLTDKKNTIHTWSCFTIINIGLTINSSETLQAFAFISSMFVVTCCIILAWFCCSTFINIFSTCRALESRSGTVTCEVINSVNTRSKIARLFRTIIDIFRTINPCETCKNKPN